MGGTGPSESADLSLRRKFSELHEERSALELPTDETKVLDALGHTMLTPELRKASGLPAERFDRALTWLRYKMRGISQHLVWPRQESFRSLEGEGSHACASVALL
jgi:hypothetical protein